MIRWCDGVVCGVVRVVSGVWVVWSAVCVVRCGVM